MIINPQPSGNKLAYLHEIEEIKKKKSIKKAKNSFAKAKSKRKKKSKS